MKTKKLRDYFDEIREKEIQENEFGELFEAEKNKFANKQNAHNRNVAHKENNS